MKKTGSILIFSLSVTVLVFLSFILYKITSNKSQNTSKIEQEIPGVVTDEESISIDGLPTPASIQTYQLDEFGSGLSTKYVYYIDINKDGKKDKITKNFYENGNAHSYNEYIIELNNDHEYINITPKNLQTVSGADCDLQIVKFEFKPNFQIIIISRELGETWLDPTMATKTILTLSNNKFNASASEQMRIVCDVKDLL